METTVTTQKKQRKQYLQDLLNSSARGAMSPAAQKEAENEIYSIEKELNALAGGRESGGRQTNGTTANVARVTALQQLYAQQRAEAQNGMNQAISTLNRSKQEGEEKLKNHLDSLLSNFQAQREQADQTVQQQYEKNSGSLNASADRSLAEAYASKMAAQRNMGQMLSAQGLTGGMSESTLMGLNNNYGKSRNNLEVGRQSALAELLSQMQQQKAANQNSYLNNAFTAQQNYQTQYEQLRQQMVAQQLAQQNYYNQLIQSIRQNELAGLY